MSKKYCPAYSIRWEENLIYQIPDIIQNIYANIYKYTSTIMKSQQPDKIKS